MTGVGVVAQIDIFPLPGFVWTIVSVAIFFLVFALLAVIGKIAVVPAMGKGLKARGVDEHARKPLLKVGWFLFLFVALGVAFAVAGFGNILSSLAVIAAAGTIALGFAMQDVLKNFVGGVFIYTDKPFKMGDWIEWDGNSGIVEDISLRVSRVRTFDNELLTVPNSQLTNNTVKNPVAKERLRVKFLFGIGYGDDIEKATNIIIEEAEAHEGILDDPAPSVRLTELGDSHVGLQSRIWIAEPSRADFIKTRGEYVTSVKNRFDEEDIEIPFPQRDLSGQIELGNGDVVSAD